MTDLYFQELAYHLNPITGEVTATNWEDSPTVKEPLNEAGLLMLDALYNPTKTISWRPSVPQRGAQSV